ncbi:hypothetical protein [Flavobacterium sp. '19STA2R22 D10 B1']|uniref:hypothetical protein n=1 Tax=Flavobacterium aerium TaxID=3037261 RepID=UPI00278C0155|nr:hypothetical protein [Flavobacterium sp. '19STA2R22 D10 B1']
MVNNAISHIVSNTENLDFNNNDLFNGKTSANYTAPDDKPNTFTQVKANEGLRPYLGRDESPAYTSGNKITYNLFSSLWTQTGQFTVNNIQNAAVHEGNGHMIKGITWSRCRTCRSL